MNALKSILIAIYPILIMLLLLTNMRQCNDNGPITPSPTEEVEESTRSDTSSIRQAQEIGSRGDLKVTLLWDFPGDIDLHVKQPNGKTICYNSRRDIVTGGFLDVDNTAGGPGSAENIYWRQPKKGEYEVKINYYGESSASHTIGQGICTVVIFEPRKEPQTYKVEMRSKKQIAHIANIIIE